MKTLQETLDYWKNPDERNEPKKYMDGMERTDFLIKKVKKYGIPFNSSILELGCNIGRNLKGLYDSNFILIKGIELNFKCNEITKNLYPELTGLIQYGSIDKYLMLYPGKSFDLIFTMAVLCHIHPDVENQVFNNMVRVSEKYILTIEDEHKKSDRHFTRNYKEVFESRGMKELENQRCKGIAGLGNNYVYRMFKK